ncbi:MAG: hypothetical protein HF975_04300 [ANME-2 cluster archaeon]|nr:hypothetical protein [ANME-2 cluster archaeon]
MTIESTARARSLEYESTDKLIQAFVNDGITSGRALNLIVYGNTLYLDEGNDGLNLYYFQLAIRLLDDIYVMNIREKHTEYQDKVRDCISIHIRARRIYTKLPILNYKSKKGRIDQHILEQTLKFYVVPGRTKAALKDYFRKQTQADTFDNFNRLEKMIPRLRNMQIKYTSGSTVTRSIIKDAVKILGHARNDCAVLDRYLDTLALFPELST